MYSDKLQEFANGYNHSFYSSICMSPSEVNESNERGLWWYMYWPKSSLKRQKKVSTFPSSKARFQFQEGDLVRITGLKTP